MNYHLNYKSVSPDPFDPGRLQRVLTQIARAAFDRSCEEAGCPLARGSRGEFERAATHRRLDVGVMRIPTHRCGAAELMYAVDRQARQVAATARAMAELAPAVRVLDPTLELDFAGGDVRVAVACEAYHR